MIRLLVTALCAALPLLSLAWALDLFREVGLYLYGEQVLAGVLGISVTLAFLTRTMNGVRRKPDASVPIIDVLAAAIGLVAATYVLINYESIFETLYERPLDATIAGTVLIVLTLEGLRRSAGNALAIVAVLFLLYGLLGHLVPGDLQGRRVAFDRLAVYLSIDSNGMLGKPLMITASVVIMFIVFGSLLTAAGGGKFFTDLSMAAMGRSRGGSAKIAIVASAFFGSISGSAVANVASTGIITIPLMKEGGFRARVAAAIESVASTGGQLMPPVMGAAAFLMAEMLQVGYDKIVIAALVPACIYFFAVFAQVDLLAARHGITAVPEHRIPRAGTVFSRGWYFVIPFLVLVGGLFWLGMRPEAAAFWSSVVVVGLGMAFRYQGEGLDLRTLWRCIVSSGEIAIDIVLIGAAAGLIIGVLNITSLGFALTLSLIDLAGDHLFFLLVLSAILSIILGMGMPTVGVYILLATLIAPSLAETGVEPIAAHMFVMYFGMMSMITPPVAIAAFTASVIAKAPPIATAGYAVRLGWTSFIIPFVFVFEPAILLSGNWADVAFSIARLVLGVWLISGCLAGQLLRPLSTVEKAIYFIVGAAAVCPDVALPMKHIMVPATMFAALACVAFDAIGSRDRDAAS